MKKILSAILIVSALLLVAAYWYWAHSGAKQPAQETRTYNLKGLQAEQGAQEGAISPSDPVLYQPVDKPALPPQPGVKQPLLNAQQDYQERAKADDGLPDCDVSDYEYDPNQGVRSNIGNLKDATINCKIRVKK